MNLLKTSSRWPLYLALIGLVIVAASVWYTNRLANRVSEIEKNFVEIYERSMNDITSTDFIEGESGQDFTTQSFVLESNKTIPAIIANADGGIDYTVNYGSMENDTTYLLEQLSYLKQHGKPPVIIPYGGKIYFAESTMIQRLRMFPFIQLAVIATFVAIGIFSINQARKAEQNRVWVGMAKETAHQLGTPISAIIGWLEHLKLMYSEDAELMEVSDEMHKDVERLEMVANRFSKIGATPELDPINIYTELDKCRAYMEKRAPRRVSFDFPDPESGNLVVGINPLLFDWVIENLLRNALDAMDGKGVISSTIREHDGKVVIDITDTGKGITSRNLRKVFNPGFTTKKRGWGLGLSLVKRIVQEYHRGRIVVSSGGVGKGATFTITLPKAG